MNVLEPRRFGIEIELSRRLLQVNHTDRNNSVWWNESKKMLVNLRDAGKISRGWRLKTDTSCGGELVSPILKGRAGLAEVVILCQSVAKMAKQAGRPAVDGECGLHLHFDVADIHPRQFSNLFTLLHMAEPIIYSMYPNRNPNYCAPIEINMNLASDFRNFIEVRDVWYRGSNNVKNRNQKYDEMFINQSTPGDHYDGTRYHGFNIHCFWRQNTVEFRYGAGTIDPLHIQAYYEMCLSMVNTAMNSKKIKLSDTLKNMKFDELKVYHLQNYRFRKLIRKLCKDCSFSRNTVKLIMELVRKNNNFLLQKKTKDSKKTIAINNAYDAKAYVYAYNDNIFSYRGGQALTGIYLEDAIANGKLTIECDAKWHAGYVAYMLQPKDSNYLLNYNILIGDKYVKQNQKQLSVVDEIQQYINDNLLVVENEG